MSDTLKILSDVLEKSTNTRDELKELAETVLDCTEFISENKSTKFSKGLLGSSREIENILREKSPDLLRDFQAMTSIVEGIQEIWTDHSRDIITAILVSSGFLLELQDREEQKL